MPITDLLNRRVRARPEEDEEDYSDDAPSEVGVQNEDSQASDSENGSEDGSEGADDQSDDSQSDNANEDEADDSEDDDDGNEDVRASLNNISFGALAKAQASLGSKSKRGAKTSKSTEEPTPSPLDDIRARILEAREQKRQALKDIEKASRSSKHAPMIQSSKKAVSRKRTIVEPPSVPKSRDPRFDPTIMNRGGPSNTEAAEKAYGFLDEYRANELKALKEQLAKTKNVNEKEELKRTIRSTSDRLRAMENKKREREVMADHKKREKQLISEGKKSNPYYMKKSDLKKQVMLKKYESMNSKDRAKALERRRKKMTSKERKEMPMERRGMGDGGDGEGRKRRRME
ncbi:rRNA biogenesis protein rrp36 [Aspergillus melleus]|uniref:rRNA biogenesis protein rrp36 n=1 Tax=Aspergillus melleus TaxID=138277 RepID=A0ACC3BG69_9EURO|nr:rRNA biogenesis protein rrp36 [Aspergillus melleus]